MAQASDVVDVLVIGAGASGGAFSWSLAEAGFNVLCLEQGGWVDPSDYPTTQSDWEIHRQTDFNPDPNLRRLPEDYPVNDTESPISPLMYNAVGGSTIHWSAHFPRFHPSDFRVKSLDGVADDWPVTYEQLEPFFDLNDRNMGVAGLAGDSAYPPKSPRQTPPIPLGKLGDTMAAGFDRLGWHWWPSDSAILTRPYDGRAACNNCGPCDIGCPLRAKASTDVTYWPKAIASGAALVTRARVREVTVGKDGLADGVIHYDADGQVQHQKARMVVLAANGVGTPRLLLNSVSSPFPNGLANSTGLVAKNLMFHPYAMVTGVFDEFLEGYKGPAGCSIISQEFYETDPSRDFVRGYAFQIVRSTGPLTLALGGVGRHRVPWGEDHRPVFDDRFGRTITIAVIGEDLPESHNRVTLDPHLADADGIPSPKITYTMSDNSLKMMDHGIARATEVLQAAGAKEVLVNPLLRPAGWHLMGTARMGTQSNNSVVDGWGRCHDVPNLLIIDGSLLVTGGAVNPTSTIQALALYVADNVNRNARHFLERT
ncbi:MAG: GMC family oxidoreductase [Dehalococcoidia bacterium]